MAQPLNAQALDKLQLFSDAANRTTELDVFCWTLIDWIEDLTQLEDCVIYIKFGAVLTQMAAMGDKRQSDREIASRIGLPVGTGIVGGAAMEGRSIYVADVSKDPRYIADEFPGRSEFCAVMMHRGQVLGVIDTEHREVDGILEQDRQLLLTLNMLAAPHVAALLDVADPERPDLAEAIADLAHLPVHIPGGLKSIFANITERASRSLHASRTNIWLLNDSGSEMTCIDHFELSSETHSQGQILERSAFPNYFRALEAERVIMANQVHQDPRTSEFSDNYATENNIASMLDAPIRQDGNVVGVICVEQQGKERRWSQEEASFVGTLSDLATIALISDRKSRAELALIRAQKMESLGRLAGGIAHDFNNLLTVISGAVETLQLRRDFDPTAKRLISLVTDASNRAGRLTRSLMAFGGSQALELKPITGEMLIDNMTVLLQGVVREDIQLSYVPADEEMWTTADLAQLEQVLLNLVLNAVDAMSNGGGIEISLHSDNANKFCVTVEDTGSGIDESIADRIFDPFFTTKGENGTGLGLSVCQGIIHQHNGTLTYRPNPGAGSLFEISLPRSGAPPAEENDTGEAAILQPMYSEAKVLLVEDEPGVRTVVSQMLQTIGYDAIVVESAKEALCTIASDDVQLLISDVVMPDMRGPELYKQALQEAPDLRALFVSGYTDDVLSEIPLGRPGINYLAKPLTMVELQTALEELLPPAD